MARERNFWDALAQTVDFAVQNAPNFVQQDRQRRQDQYNRELDRYDRTMAHRLGKYQHQTNRYSDRVSRRQFEREMDSDRMNRAVRNAPGLPSSFEEYLARALAGMPWGQAKEVMDEFYRMRNTRRSDPNKSEVTAQDIDIAQSQRTADMNRFADRIAGVMESADPEQYERYIVDTEGGSRDPKVIRNYLNQFELDPRQSYQVRENLDSLQTAGGSGIGSYLHGKTPWTPDAGTALSAPTVYGPSPQNGYGQPAGQPSQQIPLPTRENNWLGYGSPERAYQAISAAIEALEGQGE